MLRTLVVLLASLFAVAPTAAQFIDPARPGNEATASQVSGMRLGSAITLVGNIVDRRWDDYHTFRDATGDIRVEIEPNVFAGRQVSPDTRVQISGEIERGWFGRYVEVEQLVILD